MRRALRLGISGASCRTLAACAFGALLLGAGCAEIRVFTYPSEFVYLDEQGVQDTMQLMATSVRRLNRLTAAGPLQPGDERRVQAIDDELAEIEAVLGALGVGAGMEVADRERPMTNHLVIDEHVDEFLADVGRARRFLRADPPDLYPVGTIAGSCEGCHRYR